MKRKITAKTVSQPSTFMDSYPCVNLQVLSQSFIVLKMSTIFQSDSNVFHIIRVHCYREYLSYPTDSSTALWLKRLPMAPEAYNVYRRLDFLRFQSKEKCPQYWGSVSYKIALYAQNIASYLKTFKRYMDTALKTNTFLNMLHWNWEFQNKSRFTCIYLRASKAPKKQEHLTSLITRMHELVSFQIRLIGKGFRAEWALKRIRSRMSWFVFATMWFIGKLLPAYAAFKWALWRTRRHRSAEAGVLLEVDPKGEALAAFRTLKRTIYSMHSQAVHPQAETSAKTISTSIARESLLSGMKSLVAN